MSDMSGHDASYPDERHSVSLRELELRVAAAGVVISRRQLMRHCEAGTFDAKKLPATNNQDEWFVTPASIEKGIADLKSLRALRERRDATRRGMTGHDGPSLPSNDVPVMPGHDALRPVTSVAPIQGGQRPTEFDISGQTVTEKEVSRYVQEPNPIDEKGEPVRSGHGRAEPDTSRQAPAEAEGKSPYVVGLERQVEELREDREFYREQLKVKDGQIALKDEQISAMLERDRETNVLLQGLQKFLAPLLGSPRPTDGDEGRPQQ
jgi:hypothetical protein